MTGQTKNQPSAYHILSERLRHELSTTPTDEGEVFSILDIFLFSLETEEKAYLGGISRKFADSMLKILCDLDIYVGHGILRALKLLWVGPTVLSQLIKRSHEMKDGLQKCTDTVNYIKRLQIVHFVENSGGVFATPVIQKWMENRSFKIAEKDWEKLSTTELIKPQPK